MYYVFKRLALQVCFQPVFKPMDIIITIQNVLLCQKCVKERNSCIDTINNQLAQGTAQTRQSFGAVASRLRRAKASGRSRPWTINLPIKLS